MGGECLHAPNRNLDYSFYHIVASFQFIQKILSSLSQNLNKVALSQQFFRAREARHRYSLESSNSRVMSWSTVNCVVMLGVGILQVYLIRKLFRSHRQDKIKT